MSFNVKRQLLGAAGAGGGAAYFIATVDVGTSDANERNICHAEVDSSDNIYVDFSYRDSGTDTLGLLKFDTGGNVLAQSKIGSVLYPQSDMMNLFDGIWTGGIDSSGNFLVAHGNSSGYPTFLTLNPSSLNISSSFTNEMAAESVRSGNWAGDYGYVLGYSLSTNGSVAKYNSSGTQQLYVKHGFTRHPVASFYGYGPTSVSIDSSNNIYVTGTHAYYGYRAVIMKLNSSGTFQWGRYRHESSRNSTYKVSKVDSSGNVYVGGWQSESTGGKPVCYLAKYNSSGTFQWDRVFQFDDQRGAIVSIDFDSSDNVYVAGGIQEDDHAGNFGGYNWFGFYAKLNSSGTVQWQRGLSKTSAVSNGNRPFASIRLDSNDDMVLSSIQIKSGSSESARLYVARLPNDGSLTGSFSNAKYAATSLSDKAIGADVNISLNSASTGSGTSTSFSGSNSSVSYTVNLQTA